MKKLFNISFAVLLGLGVISTSIALKNNTTINEANATVHADNYADYTYSGSYYNGIDFSKSEGTRISVVSIIISMNSSVCFVDSCVVL